MVAVPAPPVNSASANTPSTGDCESFTTGEEIPPARALTAFASTRLSAAASRPGCLTAGCVSTRPQMPRVGSFSAQRAPESAAEGS